MQAHSAQQVTRYLGVFRLFLAGKEHMQALRSEASVERLVKLQQQITAYEREHAQTFGDTKWLVV